MAAYYNEHDPFAAAWLRTLIRERQIADGDVDERDIQVVEAADLQGFTQCHFFAGIGGWSYALRLAGWPDDRPVWTGSCPCQPFSAAGKHQGCADPRHLWPHWARLIRECRPVTIFGEQVESAIAHGWLDAVFDDLEREGYACGAACLPAASVGAPHRRQRLWFVADAECGTAERRRYDMGAAASNVETQTQERERLRDDDGDGGAVGDVADGTSGGRRISRDAAQSREGRHADGDGDVDRERSETSPWDDLVWLPCRDGKARPTQPGLLPLAHGVPARVGRLRGYGNAIVPQVAAEVIRAFMASEEHL